jgi:hypothetical protein
MSDIEFKIYNEDEKELLEISKNIELLNKELLGLKDLINSLNSTSSNQSPFINELEEELLSLKKSVEKAKDKLEESGDIRKTITFVSGGLGSVVGGTIGIMFAPFSPMIPLFTTVAGGITGVLYSYF